jgi:hypothetical protein
MANTVKPNRVSQLASDQKLVDGTDQLLSQLASLPVGGQDVTPAQIVQVFEGRIASGKAAVAADDARKAAVKADREERKKTAPFVQAFKRIVIGMFLQTPDKLGLFGLQAPRVGKRSAATKAEAAATAVATKKARGPIGRKQRAKVKGTPAKAGGPQPAPATPAPTGSTATAPATAAPAPVTPVTVSPTPGSPAPTPASGNGPIAPVPAPKTGA